MENYFMSVTQEEYYYITAYLNLVSKSHKYTKSSHPCIAVRKTQSDVPVEFV